MLILNGAPSRSRTYNIRLRRPLFFPLNYGGVEGDIGFAPMMRGLQPRALVYLANHP